MATRRPTREQWLVWEVQDIFVGCGLSKTGSSIVGGQNVYIPQVVSVVRGDPTQLTISILPGQHPDDFTAKAKTIAYNLGISKVEVVPLGPYLIRLDLWPDPAPGGELPRPPP